MKLVLANIARIIRTYALALWVGGLIFFVVVAGIAFGNLPSTHEAGIVVRGSLIAVHRIGIFAGFCYLFATLGLLAAGDHPRLRAIELLLALVMIGLTAYSAIDIIPVMERDRVALFDQYGTEVDLTPKDAPAHTEFDRLHNVSTKVEGGVLILGLIVLALGAIQTKPRTA